jgi:hypothetical protein
MMMDGLIRFGDLLPSLDIIQHRQQGISQLLRPTLILQKLRRQRLIGQQIGDGDVGHLD